ncbi:Acid phosphatase type 7 [Holothuria leucospilota]|uniref:Purple acid phosphatase n=1 Tax=Holothuria leucospilota TaxID=206669 RepID=A0A9Q1CJW4_HOLLE|nr:Acid phosphatase type 7 [Holothuria leucospilota]
MKTITSTGNVHWVALLTVLFSLRYYVFVESLVKTQPEQIHISATGNVAEMVVTWSTFNDTATSEVYFGIHGNLSEHAIGSSTKFVDGGSERHTQFIHRVKLTDLKPDSYYTYHCGSLEGWSALYTFHTFPAGSNWSPRLVVYGDMGNENPQSLGRLQEEVQMEMYDAILHIGDFAYDFDSGNGSVGDSFMNQIESIAAYVPYMTCPGNHENAYNFSNYKNRFTMPMFEETENLWYSWDIGPAHIIFLSTEVYFYTKYGLNPISQQRDWLVADLKKANLPEMRQQRPWIITVGHRPPYCSDVGDNQCEDLYAETVRGAFEDILYNYGVDLSFWAHEHNYERFWPLYNKKVYNGSLSEPYTNPKAPVHIVTGSAGCWEKHSVFGPEKYFDAFRSGDYGYTRLHIINNTHIDLQQVSDDQKGKVIDKITLIKTKHGMRWS